MSANADAAAADGPTLESIDRPLIHAVAGLEAAGMAPPPDRHGQSVRAWVRSLDGIQKEGVTLSRLTGRSWRFGSDEGAHLGGRDAAPNPLSFVAVGMAGSFLTELRALAASRGIALEEPQVTVESFYYRDGSFPRGTMISGALSPVVALDCRTDADPVETQRLMLDAVVASPINGLVRDEKTSLFRLVHNGREIPPIHLAALDGPALADPGDPIAQLSPAQGHENHQPLASKIGSEDEMRARIAASPPPAPVLDGTKKLLHLKTVCRLREDGSYEAVREQYAQVSSTWSFVVDDRTDTGAAMAPDSGSYFAIGLAFCYMTQLGRYAHMGKLPLHAYRVVQDLHMTTGGASSGRMHAGTADPVETHVFLDTGTDDDTARDIVRVAEQTCFLHALCRDRAKVRLRGQTLAA